MQHKIIGVRVVLTDMRAHSYPRYLITLAAVAMASSVLVVGAVAIVNPYGLVPFAPQILDFNTNKVARNTSDRLIKRYDPLTLGPQTVIVGTSRVKFAFDPEKVPQPFAPAYNAGIDALRISEARQLLEGYMRDRVPIKHVFFELFLFQFFQLWPGKDQTMPIERPGIVADFLASTMSGSAVRAAMETIIASRSSKAVATRQDGFLPLGRPYNGSNFVPPQWLASSKGRLQNYEQSKIRSAEQPITLLQEEAFTDLQRIVELCRLHNTDLRFFVGPLHPVFAYTQGTTLLHEWLRRISGLPQVISFVSTPEFRDYELERPKLYFTDYSHFSFAAADIMLADLAAYPTLRYGRILNSDTLTGILAEWDGELADWAKLNPDFVQGFNAGLVH